MSIKNLKISQILLEESVSKRKKNDTQQEYVWHLKTKNGVLKGGTSLLTLTEGICYISAKNGPIAMKRKANISIEF